MQLRQTYPSNGGYDDPMILTIAVVGLIILKLFWWVTTPPPAPPRPPKQGKLFACRLGTSARSRIVRIEAASEGTAVIEALKMVSSSRHILSVEEVHEQQTHPRRVGN